MNRVKIEVVDDDYVIQETVPKQKLERGRYNNNKKSIKLDKDKRVKRKGCTCKRSNCVKKYCECFANGLACFE